MKLSRHAVRFEMGGVPVVGNTATGSFVGLSAEGAALVAAMAERDVPAAGLSGACRELAAHLARHGYLEEAPSADPVLRTAYLHVTDTCNLSCVGCYSDSARRNVAPAPSLGDLDRALAVLADLGADRVVISGGEPFTRDDLPAVAATARDRGISTVIVLTNGTLCAPGRVEPLRGLVDIVSVSFDGPSASSPAPIRGAQLFDRLVDAVRAVRGAGIAAHILPTLHARNIGDISAYTALADRLGASLGFSLLSGEPCLLGDLLPNDRDLVRLADALLDAGAAAPAGAASDPGGGGGGALAVRASCGAGRTGASVAADGTVYPCHMLHVPELACGNAFTDAASDISRRLHALDLPCVDAIDTCSTCGKRYLCGGGCRARAYRTHHRIDAHDPYCAYYGRALGALIKSFMSCAGGPQPAAK